MKETRIRILAAGDEAALEDFLRPRIESSMFLQSNTRESGLVDRGQRLQGAYAAAFEGGRIVGVVAHYWNRNLIYQAPVHLCALTQAAVAASRRPVGGLLGPAEQVDMARRMLSLRESNMQMDEREGLYSLPLCELVVPEGLRTGRVRGRRIEAKDGDLLTAWSAAYAVEALGDEDSPELWRQCRESVNDSLAGGRTWILEVEGEPVARSSFNAAIREAVQVGGVWTPPELRGRGYGRSVVAASLLDARAHSVERAILFTGEENVPAQKAYQALGFRRIGDYGIVLLRESVEDPV